MGGGGGGAHPPPPPPPHSYTYALHAASKRRRGSCIAHAFYAQWTKTGEAMAMPLRKDVLDTDQDGPLVR